MNDTGTTNDSDKTPREIELEDLLRSAHAIAERKGEGTAWSRFASRIAGFGIGSITPKTFRVLEGDEENGDFKTRLLAETQETAGRLNKLNAFMAGDSFPKLSRPEKDLLYSQQRVMSEYVQILGKRLEMANHEFTHAR